MSVKERVYWYFSNYYVYREKVKETRIKLVSRKQSLSPLIQRHFC